MPAARTYRCYISLLTKTQVFWAGSKSNSQLLQEPMKTAYISCESSHVVSLILLQSETKGLTLTIDANFFLIKEKPQPSQTHHEEKLKVKCRPT